MGERRTQRVVPVQEFGHTVSAERAQLNALVAELRATVAKLTKQIHDLDHAHRQILDRSRCEPGRG